MQRLSLLISLIVFLLPMQAKSQVLLDQKLCSRVGSHWQNGFNSPSRQPHIYRQRDLSGGGKFYVHPTYWNNWTIRVQILTAAAEWNQYLEPQNEFIIAGPSQHPASTRDRYKERNGYSEIYPADLGSNVSGEAVQWYRGWSFSSRNSGDCEISEADIRLDSTEQPLYTPLYGAEFRDIFKDRWNRDTGHKGLVVSHELGHILGQNHQDGVLRRMNSVYPAGGTTGDDYNTAPLALDLKLLDSFYPLASNTDLAASHWSKPGVGLDFVDNFGNIGIVPYSAYSASLIYGSDPRTSVIPNKEGSQIPVTLMNRSSSHQLMRVNYYFSGDKNFSLSERFGTSLFYAAPYSQRSFNKWYTPQVGGIGYIGYTITPVAGELNIRNNTVSLWKKVQICWTGVKEGNDGLECKYGN